MCCTHTHTHTLYYDFQKKFHVGMPLWKSSEILYCFVPKKQKIWWLYVCLKGLKFWCCLSPICQVVYFLLIYNVSFYADVCENKKCVDSKICCPGYNKLNWHLSQENVHTYILNCIKITSIFFHPFDEQYILQKFMKNMVNKRGHSVVHSGAILRDLIYINVIFFVFQYPSLVPFSFVLVTSFGNLSSPWKR